MGILVHTNICVPIRNITGAVILASNMIKVKLKIKYYTLSYEQEIPLYIHIYIYITYINLLTAVHIKYSLQ